MNQEDRKELRKVLGLVEGVLFFLLCVTEGGVVLYWLVVNLIAVPAALLGLMRLVSAGRKGRFAWAAALCLLLGVGMMAYHTWKLSGALPPADVVEFWVILDPVFLVGSLVGEWLMENTDGEGRLHWGKGNKSQQ